MTNSKRNPNRFFSLMLALLLCMSVLPAAGLAEGDLQAPVVSEPTVEAVTSTLEPISESTAVPTAIPIPTEILWNPNRLMRWLC